MTQEVVGTARPAPPPVPDHASVRGTWIIHPGNRVTPLIRKPARCSNARCSRPIAVYVPFGLDGSTQRPAYCDVACRRTVNRARARDDEDGRRQLAEAGLNLHDPYRLHKAIIYRYARLTPRGKPMTCTPGDLERTDPLARRERPGSDDKVIYPDRETAETAARELEALPGNGVMRAYVCGRSRSGHAHLTHSRRPSPE